MISRTRIIVGRVALLLLCAGSFFGAIALYLPLPTDLPLLLLFEFAPRWLFALGMLPALMLGITLRFRIAIAATATALFVTGLDYRVAGCGISNQDVDLRIGTYNIGGGFVIPAEMMLWYESNRLDALLLQESGQARIWRDALNESELTLTCHDRLCVLSQHSVVMRHKFVRRQLMGEGWGTMAAVFDLCVRGFCAPLLNVHLTTPRHAIEALLAKESIARVRALMQSRNEESLIAGKIMNDPRTIVAGDFNMTQQHPIYRRVWSSWQNAFAQSGCGRGHTKFGRRLSTRIDHILAGGEWDVVETKVHQDYGGDHRPVTTGFRLRYRNFPGKE